MDTADPSADLIQTDQWIPHKPAPLKGRGAVSNPAGRFDTQHTEWADDGWHPDDPPPPDLKTEIHIENAKSILSRNQSPDLPFKVSINPYRGCEHGCIYCFARASHAFLGLSPGLDFETQLYAKVNAANLLRQALAQPRYAVAPIALGMNTDAYQPCERQLGITRELLEVLHECRHPVGVITKSALIARDIDLLSDMAQDTLAVVAITLTTLDHSLARKLEPRAASPSRRLQIIERLATAGVPVSVSVAPIIPFVTDQDLEKVLAAAVNAGASAATYSILRLPHEVNPLFQEWLQSHLPERAQRVMNAIRDLHGGEDYKAEFGHRMRGEGLFAELISQRFVTALTRLGIRSQDSIGQLNCRAFKKPACIPAKKHTHQLDLFGG